MHWPGSSFEVFSAGTEPKGGILPEVQEVMREVGIDISSQWSKSVMEYMGKVNFGYVITVCADAEENCPAVFLNMGTHEHWPFDDPAKFDEEQRLDIHPTRAGPNRGASAPLVDRTGHHAA